MKRLVQGEVTAIQRTQHKRLGVFEVNGPVVILSGRYAGHGGRLIGTARYGCVLVCVEKHLVEYVTNHADILRTERSAVPIGSLRVGGEVRMMTGCGAHAGQVGTVKSVDLERAGVVAQFGGSGVCCTKEDGIYLYLTTGTPPLIPRRPLAFHRATLADESIPEPVYVHPETRVGDIVRFVGVSGEWVESDL